MSDMGKWIDWFRHRKDEDAQERFILSIDGGGIRGLVPATVIAQLASDNGTSLSEDKAADVITDYINEACEKILDTTAVFKNTEDGQNAFERFIRSVTD